ncbi:MAG: 50S ribosomal protein L25 [Bdellovibrionales bacterium]|nr:50S ribosomal protein L25 [Bdellovibrionales bacterium]
MSTEQITLLVNARNTGKGEAGRLRRNKTVPAVVYGVNMDNKNLSVEEKMIVKYANHKFENSIFTLESSDSAVNGKKVLMKKVDRDPLSRRPVHVDFYAPDMTQEVRVTVELKFEGKAAGQADGGMVQPVRRNIEVDCLPDAIPEFILVDVTNLGLNETIHLSEITLPTGVSAASTEDLALVSCAIIEEEVIETPTAAPAEGAAAPAEGAAAAAAPAAGDKEKKD